MNFDLVFILAIGIVGLSYLAYKAGRDRSCDACFREGHNKGMIFGAALEGKVDVIKQTAVEPSSSRD